MGGFPGTDETTARGWSGVADAYAASFAHLCAGILPAVLDAADPRLGTTLLDVGAGTGALAVAAAERGAKVTAVEPDPAMRALVVSAAVGRAVVVRDGGLPDLPVTPGYDATVASFVVNHVGDPRAAVRELARVTRRGGRVVVTGWPSGRSAQARLFGDVATAAGATPPPDERLPVELDYPRTADGLAGLLREAGVADVAVRTHTWDWRIDPATLWSGVRAGVGGVGRTYTSQAAEVRARMDAAYDDLHGPLMDQGELVLPTTGILATGRA